MATSQSPSRRLVKQLFLGEEIPRPPLFSCCCSLAARLVNKPSSGILTDSTLLANSVFSAQRAIRYDAVVNIFDPTLEAEGLGCKITWDDPVRPPRVDSHPMEREESLAAQHEALGGFLKSGRLPVAIRATENIVKLLGKDVAVVATMTGPLQIARHLGGDAPFSNASRDSGMAEKILALSASCDVALANEYCAKGVDVVAVVEEAAPLFLSDEAMFKTYLEGWSTLSNVIRYFDKSCLFVLRGDVGEEQLARCFEVEADGYVIDGLYNRQKMKELADERRKAYSDVIPSSVLLGAPGGVDEYMKTIGNHPASSYFMTTPWECPAETPIPNLRRVAELAG